MFPFFVISYIKDIKYDNRIYNDITPDELKQIVREAVHETMTVKNAAPIEMKFYTRHETCEILHIRYQHLIPMLKKEQSLVPMLESVYYLLRKILISLWRKIELTNPYENLGQIQSI